MGEYTSSWQIEYSVYYNTYVCSEWGNENFVSKLNIQR